MLYCFLGEIDNRGFQGSANHKKYENFHLKYFQRMSDIFHQNAFAQLGKETSKLRTYSQLKVSIGLEKWFPDNSHPGRFPPAGHFPPDISHPGQFPSRTIPIPDSSHPGQFPSRTIPIPDSSQIWTLSILHIFIYGFFLLENDHIKLFSKLGNGILST